MIIADTPNRVVRATVDNGHPVTEKKWLEIAAIRIEPSENKATLTVIRLKESEATLLADFIRKEM